MVTEENMAILLDFVVIKNMTEAASFVKPVEPDKSTVDSQPDLPRADVKKCVCNFSSFPNINGVFVNEERPLCYDDVTDDATGTEDICYSEAMRLIGRVFMITSK